MVLVGFRSFAISVVTEMSLFYLLYICFQSAKSHLTCKIEYIVDKVKTMFFFSKQNMASDPFLY